MFSRLHVEEIRRRKLKQNRETNINGTNAVGMCRNTGTNERKALNLSYNVAKHVGRFGQISPFSDHRLSLPLRPTGCRESKLAHRIKSPLLKHEEPNRETVPSGCATVPKKETPVLGQTTKHQSDKSKQPSKEPIRIEDCHHLCLPQHVVDRLRPIWAHFEQSPPRLTRPSAEDALTPSFRFADVRSRLRKAKEEMNVDLDEMFSKLGLNVDELKSKLDATPIVEEKVPKPEEKSETPKRETPPLEDMCPSPIPPHDAPPAKKRVCRTIDYLYDLVEDRQRNQSDAPNVLTRINARAHSLSDLSERLHIPEHEKRTGPIGMDILTLKMCSMRSNRGQKVHSTNFSKPQRKQTFLKPTTHRIETVVLTKPDVLSGNHLQREARPPGRIASKEQRGASNQPLGRYDKARQKETHDDRMHTSLDGHTSVQETKGWHELRSSFRQGEQFAHPTIPHSIWSSPEAHPVQYPRILEDERRHMLDVEWLFLDPSPEHTVAPSHPLWDTPEELRTSTNFTHFYL
ncbi:unnamed protein product [Dicrocoelium dendriticum]|nr:unnamed protein product [Dicrocoelium dendriticum]